MPLPSDVEALIDELRFSYDYVQEEQPMMSVYKTETKGGSSSSSRKAPSIKQQVWDVGSCEGVYDAVTHEGLDAIFVPWSLLW